jgi:hypothetical protein
MTRRIIRDESNLEAIRERDKKETRTLKGGAVLNILQWVRPGEARFTLEGEGAEVWTCDESAVHEATAP